MMAVSREEGGCGGRVMVDGDVKRITETCGLDRRFGSKTIVDGEGRA